MARRKLTKNDFILYTNAMKDYKKNPNRNLMKLSEEYQIPYSTVYKIINKVGIWKKVWNKCEAEGFSAEVAVKAYYKQKEKKERKRKRKLKKDILKENFFMFYRFAGNSFKILKEEKEFIKDKLNLNPAEFYRRFEQYEDIVKIASMIKLQVQTKKIKRRILNKQTIDFIKIFNNDRDLILKILLENFEGPKWLFVKIIEEVY